MNDYLSTARHFGEVIDCRCLSLGIEFYQMSGNTVHELAHDIIRWISQLLKDSFIVRRTIVNRSVSEEVVFRKLQEAIQSKNWFSLITEAMAVSPVVYNVKTYKEYFHTVFYKTPSPTPSLDVSRDYPTYWDSLFGDRYPDDDEIRTKLMQIFRQEGRYLKSFYGLPDVQSLLSLCPYHQHTDQFYGSFEFSFSAHCLDKHISDMATTFAAFVKRMSEKFVKINARVMLQPLVGPKRYPHMTLFGNDPSFDDSHTEVNCTPREWYPTYYIPGVEWYNILSPLAQRHLPGDDVFLCQPASIFRNMLSGGGIEIGSQKWIHEYDISDALALKRLIYPALFPGRSCCPLKVFFKDPIPKNSMSNFPRSNWAIIPVFTEEMSVRWKYLIFEKKLSL